MASSTQPYGKLLDYEQYIDHQLGRTRAKIKMTDVLTASLMLVAVALGVLFLEVVLDHAVGLPIWLRRIVLFSELAGAAAFSAVRIVLPLIRRVNGLYAAKTIEEADPAFQNSLINYLELRRRRGELPKSFLAAIEAKAVNDLTQVEIDAVVNQRRLIHVWYALAAVVLLFCGYAALTPKSISDSARRALLADVVRPTNTRLRNIKPGDDPELSRVVAGTHVPFTVDVEGTSPPRVVLHYSVDGGKFFAIQELAPGKNQYDPWQTTLRNVQQSIEYYLTGGDAESLRYHLEVSPAPMVTSVSLDYRFPDYLGLPPRTAIEGGNVEAIEGTVVTVHARTNEPARSASLVFTKAQPEPMEVASDDPRTLVGRFKVEESGTYTIKFQTTGGQANPEPVVYDILALPDKAPTAQFLRPDQAKVKVPSNVPVALVMRANDDHGVKDVTLHVHEVKAREGKKEVVSLVSENLLEKKPPVREFHGTKTLDLAALRVKPGARLEYWLTVRDTKQPESNQGESPHQYLDVADPVPPKEQKKFEDAARNEKEQEVPPEAAQAENPEQAPPPQEAPAKPGREAQPPQDRGGAGQQRRAGREDEKTEPRASDRGVNEREGDNQAQRQPPTNPDDLRKLDKLREALGMKRPQQPPQGGGQRNAQGENAPPPANATGQPGSQTQNDPNSANPSGSVASGNRTAGQQSRANAPSNPSTMPPNGAPNPNTTPPEVARANPNQTPSTQAQPNGQQGQPGARSRANNPRRGAPGARSRANANSQQGQPDAQSQVNADGQQGQPGEQSQANANSDGQGQTAAPSQANGQRGEPGTQSQPSANGQQGTQTQANGNGQQGPPRTQSQDNANGQQGEPGTQSQAHADGQKAEPGAQAQANANGHQGEPGAQTQADAHGQRDEPGERSQANANGQKGQQSRTNGPNGQPGTRTQANANEPKGEPDPQAQAKTKGQSQQSQANADGQKSEPGMQSRTNNGQPQGRQNLPNGQPQVPRGARNSRTPPNGQTETQAPPDEQPRNAPTSSDGQPQGPQSEQVAQTTPDGQPQGAQDPPTGSRQGPRGDQGQPNTMADRQDQGPRRPAPQNRPRSPDNRQERMTDTNRQDPTQDHQIAQRDQANQAPEEPPTPPDHQAGQPGTTPSQSGQNGRTNAQGRPPNQGNQASNSPGQDQTRAQSQTQGHGQTPDQGQSQGQGQTPGQGQSPGQGRTSGQGQWPGQGQSPGPGQSSGVSPGQGQSPSRDQGQGSEGSQGSGDDDIGSGQPGGHPSNATRPSSKPRQGNPRGRSTVGHEGAPSDARSQTRLNQTSQGSNSGQPGATSGRPGTENSQTPPSGQGSEEQGRPGESNGPGDTQGQPQGQPGNEAEQPGGQDSGTVPEGQGGHGGAGRSPHGGGGNRPGAPGGPAAPDTSKPSPRAESRPVNSEETVAPDVPQSDLVLRKLEDLLRSDQVTPQLEQETGMSREQMEQFVQKFKKAPNATPGPGRAIQAKPEPVRTFDPNRKLPDLNPNAKIGSRTIRDRNSFVQDQEHNNLQGPLFEAPSELRSKFDAYRSSLSRSKVATPTRSAPADGGR